MNETTALAVAEDTTAEELSKQIILETVFESIQPMISEAAKGFEDYLMNDKGGRTILIKASQGKVFVLDIQNKGITKDIEFDTSADLLGNPKYVEVTDLTTFLLGLAKVKA